MQKFFLEEIQLGEELLAQGTRFFTSFTVFRIYAHSIVWNGVPVSFFSLSFRRLWEGCGPSDQRHRRVRSASAAPPGAAADSPSTRLPDAPHEAAHHQSGERNSIRNFWCASQGADLSKRLDLTNECVSLAAYRQRTEHEWRRHRIRTVRSKRFSCPFPPRHH